MAAVWLQCITAGLSPRPYQDAHGEEFASCMHKLINQQVTKNMVYGKNFTCNLAYPGVMQSLTEWSNKETFKSVLNAVEQAALACVGLPPSLLSRLQTVGCCCFMLVLSFKHIAVLLSISLPV